VRDPFDAAGSLRAEYRRVDWAASPLGPVSTWSPTLIAAVDLALNTRFPVTLFWGPRGVLLYNEGYAPMIGNKHPAALGTPIELVFPEIWEDIGPMVGSVLDGHGGTWVEDLRLLMERRGFPEECYFTFSYSAVHNEAGEIEGIIDIAAETTQQVLAQRRLRLLSRLNDELADLDHPQQILDRALPVLRTDHDDLPEINIALPGAPIADGANLPDRPPPRLAGRNFVVEADELGSVAWIRLTGGKRSRQSALLVTRLSRHLPIDDAYLRFVRLLGGAVGQALNRTHMRQAERRVAAIEREMSETLQRSLLTPPPKLESLEVAVRYQPAMEQAQVGGDWYDSFRLPNGKLAFVVGDVTGHDSRAAAAMAQIRNLLRGISYALREPPARVLSGMDEAMSGLEVNVFATVILAQITVDEQRRTRTMQWTNAGHPAPVLLSPDGSARLLETPPELLLGARSRVTRSDHDVLLEPGSSVVLYTDGLVERRGQPFDDRLAALVAAVSGRQHLTAEQLCDHLIDRFAGLTEDDIVLSVLRVSPQGRPDRL
jgi:serine phosphatase RsbU (regulator of sigma subunit)